MPRATSHLLIVLLSLALSGCSGTLGIWGVNIPLPGQDDDDDDGLPPDVDLSNFQGVEYMNIRWSPEQADEGLVDCEETFDTIGTLLDETEGCDSCDVVWEVTMYVDDETRACTSQGTGLTFESSFDRRVGMNFIADGEFLMYRGTADDDQLEQVGEGAFNGLNFTWSGVGSWEKEYSDEGFTLFLSGEGYF